MPIIDIYEKFISDLIEDYHKEQGIAFEKKPFWPDNKRFALCLTHDVDRVEKTYQGFTRFFKQLKRGEFRSSVYHLKHCFKKSGVDPYWNFEKIKRMEKKMNVRSTFFFLNEKKKRSLFRPSEWSLYSGRYNIHDEKIVATIKSLSAEGWELGLHGSYESYNNKELLKKELKTLVHKTGSEIIGSRQHHLNLKVPDTWIIQDEVGLQYDSTAGFNGRVGFKCGTCFPFHPLDAKRGRALGLLEIPMVIMDVSLFAQDDAWRECKKIIEIVEKHNGVLTLVWHQRVFNENEFPGWSKSYKRIIQLCKTKNAWIVPGKEIYAWWSKRERCIE